MVVKMMKWRPWPPLMSRKFEVKVVVCSVEGFGGGGSVEEMRRLVVEVRWKGTKNALSALRRTVKRNLSREEEMRSDGVVEWNEEFQSVCTLSHYKENVFHPWEINFALLQVVNQGPKTKSPIIGTASLNLSEYAAAIAEKENFEVNVPLTLTNGDAEHQPSICLSLSLLELRTSQELTDTVQRSLAPLRLSPRADALITEKEPLSPLKAGLKKVKLFKEYVATRRAKKSSEEEDSEGRYSGKSDDADFSNPFDTDSRDDSEEEELGDNKDDSSLRKSFSYGTLAHANFAGGSYYSDMRVNGESEDWIYFSNPKSDVGNSLGSDLTIFIPEPSLLQSSKRSLLSWRKRKLSFRSPRAKAKGEPLLKKAYGEEGGDDIDFDRRQLNSSDESSWHKADEGSATNRSSVSEFGDDNFAVGSWEHKDLISRDGNMKLSTQVFFASIDQRSERAAGESACTALVAVIADWFQGNQDHMPIKSQFDSLIRDGSLEWRNLCENETYRARFPDKHFDLDTVLQAKIRPLAVTPEKSFIGFFHPEGMEDGGFDFLHGAMSFDGIWDEICHLMLDSPSSTNPHIYIVSWNDHFFVLKVEPEAYYIIDTLGERLYEGCNQAYILKFDRDTTICRLPQETQTSEGKPVGGQADAKKGQVQEKMNPKETPGTEQPVAKPEESENSESEVVCKGKESCKEYIKSFLAAIPIRELQVDYKKGLMDSTPLHHRLQIELHYTEFLQPTPTPEPQALQLAESSPVQAETSFYQPTLVHQGAAEPAEVTESEIEEELVCYQPHQPQAAAGAAMMAVAMTEVYTL